MQHAAQRHSGTQRYQLLLRFSVTVFVLQPLVLPLLVLQPLLLPLLVLQLLVLPLLQLLSTSINPSDSARACQCFSQATFECRSIQDQTEL